MLMPMANIMAVVAVLEIQAERKAVTAPKPNKMRLGRAPIHGNARMLYAKRLLSPCTNTARAKMNEPMNRNMM